MRFVPRLGRLSVALLALAPSLALPALAQTKPTAADVACAAMGPGFKRISGSDTCMQLSGSVEMTAARGTAPSNAPNQGFTNTPTAAASGTPAPAGDPWKQMR
ncbi:hypothetical protein [Azorhizobium]|nr:hypothetical protein [Azorhizobium]TDT92671.1 hypothetical protein DFO45_3431 [Azorhizobium sp. AG788]